tara:strand:+ start:8425 stop:8667 length:243 start_codon:yes stop_codon:yes gene_type:complete
MSEYTDFVKKGGYMKKGGKGLKQAGADWKKHKASKGGSAKDRVAKLEGTKTAKQIKQIEEDISKNKKKPKTKRRKKPKKK